MANIEYKPVWSEDGQTLSNVLVKDKLETYNVVTEWYDGSPIDDSKLDSDLVYVKYDGEYLVRNFEYGQVLQKDTMQEMRDLSSYEILLLKMGVYKHVQLNGYYEKGDTPSPINYTLSNTEEEDNGGSVFEVGGIKLEHDFNGYINIKYYGAVGDNENDDWESFQKCFNYAKNSTIIIPKGVYLIKRTLIIPTIFQNKIIGEGKLSRWGGAFGPADGIVRLNFLLEDEEYTKAIYYKGETQQDNLDAVFENIFIFNSNWENRDDIDGLYIDGQFKNSYMQGVTIMRFRENLVITNDFYYTIFKQCSFVRGTESGVRTGVPDLSSYSLANGSIFEGCIISRNKVGYRGAGNGELLNFKNCYFEHNSQYAISVRLCKTINISNSYIEFNGEDGSTTSGDIYISNSGGTFLTSVNCVLNMEGNFIFSRGSSKKVVVNSPNKIKINLKGNLYNISQNNGSQLIRLIDTGQSSNVSVYLSGNNSIGDNQDVNRMSFSNVTSTSINEVISIGDLLSETLFPYTKENNNVNGLPDIIPQSGNLDQNSYYNIDFKYLQNNNAYVDLFKTTNTIGNKFLRIFKGDGSGDIVFVGNANNGDFRASSFSLLTPNRTILTGGSTPNLDKSEGSLYLRTQGNIRPYYKTTGFGGDVNGWKPLAYLEETHNTIEASADTATQAAGETPTKAEFDALLAELRDLKTKMRAGDAPILSS